MQVRFGRLKGAGKRGTAQSEYGRDPRSQALLAQYGVEFAERGDHAISF
jgi:hypothetical protein